METRCEESVGFTLIELLIAMAIGVTIASLAVPAVVGSIESARVARCVGEVRALEGDIAAYQTANDEVLPNGLADIKRDTLRDPWGSQYQYLNFANVIGKTAMRKGPIPCADQFRLRSLQHGKRPANASSLNNKGRSG